MSCRSCGAALPSPVAFCPFCGASQAAAPTPEPVVAAAPEPPAAPVPPPAPPPRWPATGSPWARAASVPPAGTARTKTVPAPAARARRRFLRWPLGPIPSIALFALVALAFWVTHAPLPHGTLLVRVRAPSGPVSTGSVLVDGNRAGPPGTAITVSAGPHEVSFAEPGILAEKRQVEVGTDAQVTVDLLVREAPARLTVTTTPAGATVRVAGRPGAPAPLVVELPPGTYDVVAAVPGLPPRTTSVRLGRGEARSLAVDLSPPAAPRLVPPPFERGVVVAPTPLVAAPGGAEGTEALAGGTPVQVLGGTADGTWLQVRGGGRTGFVRGESVESFDGWAARSAETGLIDGVTGNLRLIVSGRPVLLAGVRLPEGPPSPGLSRMTANVLGLLRGTAARCLPQDALRFVCKTLEGRDISEMFLLNGAAMLGAGALPYYADAERVARESRRGLWSD